METKKRLIDANTLKRHMIKAMEFANVKTINKDDIAYAIDNADAVDAVEVVHAHWVEWYPGDCALIMTGEEMLHQCSSCSAKYSDVEGFRYFPHCGAFMDGGSTDEP